MPLSHAVIKSAMARKKKRTRDDGGLTAKNKNANVIVGSRNTGGLISSNTPSARSNRMGGEVYTPRGKPASSSNKTNYVNVKGKNKKSSGASIPHRGVNYIAPKLRKAKKNKLTNALPSYRR
jgi:hypothetical protein